MGGSVTPVSTCRILSRSCLWLAPANRNNGVTHNDLTPFVLVKTDYGEGEALGAVVGALLFSCNCMCSCLPGPPGVSMLLVGQDEGVDREERMGDTEIYYACVLLKVLLIYCAVLCCVSSTVSMAVFLTTPSMWVNLD